MTPASLVLSTVQCAWIKQLVADHAHKPTMSLLITNALVAPLTAKVAQMELIVVLAMLPLLGNKINCVDVKMVNF